MSCMHTFVFTVIQILFVEEREHWVVSSFVNGKLSLYDSCATGELTPSLEVQLAQIYQNFAVNSRLKVQIEPVQQQEGSMECGVFSIANAYNAAVRKTDISYDQPTMRAHIQHCFQARKFSPFPRARYPTEIRRCNPKELYIKLYCICSLPETFDGRMVQCTNCQKWFHFKCMGIKTKPRGTWLCTICQ